MSDKYIYIYFITFFFYYFFLSHQRPKKKKLISAGPKFRWNNASDQDGQEKDGSGRREGRVLWALGWGVILGREVGRWGPVAHNAVGSQSSPIGALGSRPSNQMWVVRVG